MLPKSFPLLFKSSKYLPMCPNVKTNTLEQVNCIRLRTRWHYQLYENSLGDHNLSKSKNCPRKIEKEETEERRISDKEFQNWRPRAHLNTAEQREKKRHLIIGYIEPDLKDRSTSLNYWHKWEIMRSPKRASVIADTSTFLSSLIKINECHVTMCVSVRSYEVMMSMTPSPRTDATRASELHSRCVAQSMCRKVESGYQRMNRIFP